MFLIHVVQNIFPAKTYSDAKPLRSTQILVQSLGRFPFNKNSGVKFWKFHVPNGTVHSGCTDQTQATTHLVIVLVSRMQKNCTGHSNFPKWKRTFLPDQLEGLGGSKWSTFKAGPKYSGRTEPKWSINLVSNQNFQNFGLNGKCPSGSHMLHTYLSQSLWCCPKVWFQSLEH